MTKPTIEDKVVTRHFLCKEGSVSFYMEADNAEEAEEFSAIYNAVVIGEVSEETTTRVNPNESKVPML